MSLALYIPVKETLQELRSVLKKASPMMQPRIKMLIVMKKAGEKAVSKRELMNSVGACSQSIHDWRTIYKEKGLEALLYNGRIGKAGKPSVFTKQEHEKIEKKLKDPRNGLAGYIELQEWIEQEFKKEVKYNTLLKYAIRHFNTKVKVARKSHVKKDPQAVEAFKKTLRKK
ncbi:MAG: winged helix-turn-helix domain-containing protein [Bacteroidetes bacterium]|nr:winged helix-turn-helix domain-containing protein [Bacteroidota bacterium]